MKLVTGETLAAEAAARWARQYSLHGWDGPPELWPKGSPAYVYHQLLQLGPNPSPADVDRVIGNDSWTHVWCFSCKKHVSSAVVLGQEDDAFCESCLSSAHSLIATAARSYKCGCPAQLSDKIKAFCPTHHEMLK